MFPQWVIHVKDGLGSYIREMGQDGLTPLLAEGEYVLRAAALVAEHYAKELAETREQKVAA